MRLVKTYKHNKNGNDCISEYEYTLIELSDGDYVILCKEKYSGWAEGEDTWSYDIEADDDQEAIKMFHKEIDAM